MALDDKTNRKLWLGFTVVLALLLLLDPKLLELLGFLPRPPAHELDHQLELGHGPHFVVDGWPGFFAVFGFVGAWLLVMATKLVIGKPLMRPDTYYDHSPLDPTRDAKLRRIHHER
jgi:hypothetical protein